MTDRGSRPHAGPNKTTPQLVRAIVGLRWRPRLGPVQIAGRLGVAASTVTTTPTAGLEVEGWMAFASGFSPTTSLAGAVSRGRA